MIEVKKNEMLQSFLVERSWNKWCLSKKSFCTRRPRKNKIFGRFDHKLTERKVV